MTERKLGRYQQKLRQGLVPTFYDRTSRSFKEGAFKNWPNRRDENKQIVWTQNPEDRDVRADRQLLEMRQR